MEVEPNIPQNSENACFAAENNICIENPSILTSNLDIHCNNVESKGKTGCFPYKVAHDELKGR